MAGIKLEGADKLQKALKQNVTLNDVKRVVRRHGAALQQRMQRHADFTRGYQTGATKRSIGMTIGDNGMSVSCGPGTEYAEALEYGTRYMLPQPFVAPAENEQKELFLRDMKKLTR